MAFILETNCHIQSNTNRIDKEDLKHFQYISIYFSHEERGNLEIYDEKR